MVRDYVGLLEIASNVWVDSLDRDPLIGSIVRGDASREEYLAFLGATYHYVRWSGALLSRTAEGLRRSGRYPWLLALVDGKAEEEAPHDRWVLADLERCGEDVARVEASPVPAAVEIYVDWSLTLADEGSPAFLGAAYSLEFISMRRAKMAAENLRARRAIPGIEGAVSFLAGHGDADVDHIAQLGATLRRIEAPRDQAAIQLSAAVTRELYPRFFRRGAAGAIASPAR